MLYVLFLPWLLDFDVLFKKRTRIVLHTFRGHSKNIAYPKGGEKACNKNWIFLGFAIGPSCPFHQPTVFEGVRLVAMVGFYSCLLQVYWLFVCAGFGELTNSDLVTEPLSKGVKQCLHSCLPDTNYRSNDVNYMWVNVLRFRVMETVQKGNEKKGICFSIKAG